MPSRGPLRLQGVFNQSSIQPPSLPAPVLDVSAPARPLRCYAADTSVLVYSSLPNRPMATSSRPVSAAASSRASRLVHAASNVQRDDQVAELAAELFSCESQDFPELEPPSAQSARRSPPRTLHSAERREQRKLSPRRKRLGVMDSLMYNPSFSIADAVLASPRTSSTPRR
jgi:hypothetical protein